jgi:hypothetical protein
MVPSFVSLTLASIDNTEIVRRYIALGVGCVLGMLAQWVVMAQAQEEAEHEGRIDRGFARIVSGGLASLVAGFFVLDRLGETPIIDAQFRLWLAMLIAGFGGMGVLELAYHHFVKKLTGKGGKDA